MKNISKKKKTRYNRWKLQCIRIRDKVHEGLEFGVVILHIKLIIIRAAF